MARDRNGIAQSTWKNLSTSLAANSADLPHLEGHRTLLVDVLSRTEGLTTQRAALTASKQEVSQQLEKLMGEGRKLATFLRVGVKQHYGNRAEKLIEFGLRPLRTRRKADAVATGTTPSPNPTAGKPDPGKPTASSTGAPAPTSSGQ
jgi:hypothetical protein